MAAAGPRYAPEDPSLPKPWRGLVDGNTGNLYFWNPVTNVTQYQRPSVPNDPPPPQMQPPVSPATQVQPSSQDDSGVTDDDVITHERSGNGETKCHEPTNGVSDNTYVNETPKETVVHMPAVGSGLSPDAYRKKHEITVSGDNVPPPFTSFQETCFPSELLKDLIKTGFSAPTPIQAQSWPIAMQNRDIVAVAKTGSGKTLGYLIPGFIHLKKTRKNPQLSPTVLVLSPTRELATQIQDEAIKFGKGSRISCTCLYGGAPKGPQLRDLANGTDIVVATPGRLNDILEMRKVSLSDVTYLVLDEADRMLDMGFEPQIRKIINAIPPRRQTLMYTATWPKEVRKIAADFMVNPVQVNIGNINELVANKSITQHVEVLSYMEKHKRLEQILRSQKPGSKIIIFCATKKMCDQLARNLTRPFGAAAIHGDKNQGERDHVLSQFKSGKCPILVATDVAARGLDVKDIRVVVNYDFPTGVEDYVHRIGRTGRAGATGEAYTFFGDQDAKYASDLVKILEGANQRVPDEVRQMASRGGGMGGGGRSRRWSSDGGGGGYGGRGGGGYDSGYGGGRGRGFSSERDTSGGGGGGYQGKSFHETMSGGGGGGSGWGVSRERSRSPERFNDSNMGAPPVRSFHQAMMERARTPPVFKFNVGSEEGDGSGGNGN
ncbi:hypothetical protein LXL04_013276 [Taraxacum kok-saghyz]